jgi:uncharacterized repeat protein (TIGR04052 family)
VEKHLMNNRTAILMATLALASFGCDSSSGGSGGSGGTGGAGSALAVTIQLAAKVGTDDFVCGDTYDHLGANDSSLQLSDFRFYVQEVELLNADGDYVPLQLDSSTWQTDNVVLLDFEDACNDAGTPEMNTVVTGTVPTGTYDGLRFKMGVPFDLNHDNPATAEPPLNLTTMQWNWQGGYKFLRLDSGTFSTTDWCMHLGSTGCDGDPIAGGTTTCDNPKRTQVTFADFDPAADTVIADFKSLVDGADLEANQSGTPVGCMAGPTDGDCAPLFDKLGLPFDGSEPDAQQFFSVE